MKRYIDIGELLKDFRELNGFTKFDLAEKFDVDIRTINRWEKNQSLLKPDKEALMVDITFIPYQVIRNLNAPVTIPTFYDFSLRKYSISELSNEVPNLEWILSMKDLKTDRIRTLKSDVEIDLAIRSTMVQADINKEVSKDLILKAISLLPEINLIIFDNSGYYSGHSIYFPLSNKTYLKIRNREITEHDITMNDLVDFRTEENPVFYLYDISSDCNETLFFVSAALSKFFQNKVNKNFTTASFTSRHDSIKIQEQAGSTLVWEDKELQKQLKSKAAPRLYEKVFII